MLYIRARHRKGSERLHRWLINHLNFGGYLRDWEAEQVIPSVGKYSSTLTMVPLVTWAILTREIPRVFEVAMVATVVGTLLFIWTRPSRRSKTSEEPAP